MSDTPLPQHRALPGQSLPTEATETTETTETTEPEEQLELEALPTMLDLDELQSELDDIDRVLVDLEGNRPDRRGSDVQRPTPPTPSQSGSLAPAR